MEISRPLISGLRKTYSCISVVFSSIRLPEVETNLFHSYVPETIWFVISEHMAADTFSSYILLSLLLFFWKHSFVIVYLFFHQNCNSFFSVDWMPVFNLIWTDSCLLIVIMRVTMILLKYAIDGGFGSNGGNTLTGFCRILIDHFICEFALMCTCMQLLMLGMLHNVIIGRCRVIKQMLILNSSMVFLAYLTFH